MHEKQKGMNCSLGNFPFHNAIGAQFRCSVRKSGYQKGLKGACRRMCIVNPEFANKAFLFDSFEDNFCSHILLSSIRFTVSLNMHIKIKFLDKW